MPPPLARLRCPPSSNRAGSHHRVFEISHVFVLLLLLAAAVATADPTAQPPPSSGDSSSRSSSKKGFLASVADAVGGAFFGGSSMGQAAGKPFGERAATVVNKPLGCPTGWEREEKQETATFAAGCFWGVELAFQRVPGVISTRVGYTGGHTPNPTYKQVCSGTTGHAEAVEIVFDPDVVTYRELLTVLWDRHDPTTKDRQGGDVGTQYRSAIFYHSDEQRHAAEASIREEQARRPRPIVTEVVPASTFYAAEEYHQQYLEKGGQCSRKGDLAPIRCYG